MNSEIQIRTVTVELLRAGPAHNQLLSPLMQYLGICGNHGAGIVTQPYEHATFLRRMKAMRYDSGDNKERLAVLRDIGMDMANILGAVPGLPGALTAGGGETLVHLRLRLSASELALLPFELAKVPVGPSLSDESWLALQTRMPVCVTRRSLNATFSDSLWPARPRILFIAANPDPANIPYEEHRFELVAAVMPFFSPGEETPLLSADGRREQFGHWLTILKDASFAEVAAECAENAYTHVHILAHGGVDADAEDTAYGLVLRTAAGESDVVSGDRFASAFARFVAGKVHRPTVVTLATCDSGNTGSVIIPGASLAHALHLAGIPLVVASQFPLSKAGSVALVNRFYRGLIDGDDPWMLLHRIRTDLHGRFAKNTHDWASLVVYEGLPDNLGSQLELLRYQQRKRAIGSLFGRIDHAVRGPKALTALGNEYDPLAKSVQLACDSLPMDGEFRAECLGLRASSGKRLAQAEYCMAVAAGAQSPDYRYRLLQSCGRLEQALTDYWQAARGFLVNEGKPLQRIASLHWVLVQMLSMHAVLGKPGPEGAWETAQLSAQAYLDHPSADERAWAQGSLAELWLLKLADERSTPETRADAARQAKARAAQLANLYPTGDAFPIESTRKQFERYVDWWGQPAFEGALAEWGGGERPGWGGEGGVVETANAVIAILARHTLVPRAEPAAETPAQPGPPAGQAANAGKLSVAAAPAAKKKPAAAPQSPGQACSGEPFLTVEMLPAGHGDCLWLQYGQGQSVSRVLVDCGTDNAYARLRQRVSLQPEPQRDFELFILSHIDADHIGGAIPFLKDRSLGAHFADIWFNGFRHLPSDTLDARQGEVFSALIQQCRLPWNQWRDGGPVMVEGEQLPVCTLPGGMTLTLLSPTKDKLATLAKKWKAEIEALGLTAGKAADFPPFLRDTPSTSTDVDALADAPFKGDSAAPNGSSIAVLAEYRGKGILLGADAHAPALAASIQKLLKQRGADRLKIDAFKVSHHGSQNNLNIELLKLLDCRHYLISTNGDYFKHPDREAVGRIIKYGGDRPALHFNFRTEWNTVWEQGALQEKYGYSAFYPEAGQAGLLVRL
jgi:hypothetical protein